MFSSNSYENMISTPTFDNFTTSEYESSSLNQLGDEDHSVEGVSCPGPAKVKLIPNGPDSTHNANTTHGQLCDEDAPISAETSIQRTMGRKGREEISLHCRENCKVCGDRSTGCHYDIPSCNGCKSFFRRTVLDQRRFVCESEEKCPVLPKTRKEQKRRHCRACRFRRCIDVGMNPMGIVVEKEEDLKALKLALKRPALLLNDRVVSIDEHANRLVDNLAYLEFKHQLLRRSELNPMPTDPQSILDVLMRHSAMGEPQKEMTGWPLKEDVTRAVMSLEEHAQLRIPMPRLRIELLPPSFKFWFYAELVYGIEWAKSLDFFRILDLTDQRELIRFSGWQLSNVTHSYFSYSRGSDKGMFPDGKFSVWTPREADRDVITHFFRLQIDKIEYLILKGLIICNPTCETISIRARSILQEEREKMTKILLNHCMNTQGRANGAARFGEIVALEGITLKQALKTKHLQSLLSVLNLRPMRINIMDEICDINYES